MRTRPRESQVAARAVRELDGVDEADGLIDALILLDSLAGRSLP
jgi:hypothetical protein